VPDENNVNIDDDFLAELENDDGSGLADPFTTEGSESAAADPFSNLDDPSADDPFGLTDAADAVESAVAEEPTGKKGKKGKKGKGAKAKKEKAPKAAKVKKEKEKKPKSDYTESPMPIFVLIGVLIFALLVANIAAFVIAGASCVTYLIVLDGLGLLMLLIPVMLLSGLRKKPIELFDFFLALAAIFSIAATLFVISGQARDYGASSKVSATSAASVLELSETMIG
jgi:hypothetical protein